MSKGDFEAFYKRHYQLVYRICFSYMKTAAEAEDCTEDVFVKVLTEEREFEDETHEKKWLTVTAMNLCKDKLKHWWRKKAEPEPEAVLEAQSESFDYRHDELMQAVMGLPPKYKDVILMFYCLGYQTEEIARLLDKPPSTVRNLLRDARLRLKKILGDDLNE